MGDILKAISEIGIISLFVRNPILRVILGLIVIGLIIAGIVQYYRHRDNHTTTTTMPTMPTQIPAGLQNTNQAIENFAAISDADYKTFIDAASSNGLTQEQKAAALAKLGCQNAVDQNMQGYRSAESGATFKVEEVQKTGIAGYPKYIIHAADNLVIAVDNNTGRLSRVIKNTSAEPQLFDREPVMGGTDGKTATGAFMFTKTLASKVKFALQYEHEALSLRPLDTSVTPARPWRGQQFVLDVNLKGALLDAAAFSLGYKLAPGLGPQDLQNVGVGSVGGGTGSSSISLGTTADAAASGNLGALTKAQLDTALAAAVANINAFNRTSGGAQPGTPDNPFANKPLKINLNLAGLGGNPTQPNPISGLVSGFSDIPKTESFTDMAAGSGTGQIRNLIQAWDAAQNPGSENDFGGMPAAAGTLGNALRGKMLSCPKLDRTQYYTERQLSQCAGCTPDPYLRGQLGGKVYA